MWQSKKTDEQLFTHEAYNPKTELEVHKITKKSPNLPNGGSSIIGIGNRGVEMSYACPCCSYLTFDEEPPGTFEICPVCGWEDDEVQFHDSTYEGGANSVSLEQARVSFAAIGAIDKESLDSVRKPLPEEIPAESGGQLT